MPWAKSGLEAGVAPVKWAIVVEPASDCEIVEADGLLLGADSSPV